MPALLVKKDIKILYSVNICGEINILYVTLLTIENLKQVMIFANIFKKYIEK